MLNILFKDKSKEREINKDKISCNKTKNPFIIINTNEENKIEMKGVLSNIQDVDVADAFIKYKSAEMVYTASLQVTAKIFNNTILDYLR